MAKKSSRGGRIIIYLAIILILVVVLAFVFKDRLIPTATPPPKATTAPTVVQQDMVNIVFTTQPVTRGTIFNADELALIPIPNNNSISGTFFNNINDVVGKVAKFDLDAQVPLTKGLVVVSGSINAQEIPAGMVAISIPLNNRLSSVSYAPQAGDHVNIIAALAYVDLDTNFQSILPDKVGSVTAPSTGGATPETPPDLTVKVTTDNNVQGTAELDSTLGQPIYIYPSEAQRPRLVSQTLVQDAVVLGVGNFLLPSQIVNVPSTTQTVGSTPSSTIATANVYPDTITVIVSPQDAVTLNYLIYSGAELTLVLRGSGDSQRVQTEAVTLQYLMDQYNIPIPTKLPYGTDPRTDGAVPVNPLLQLDPRYNIPTPAQSSPTPVPTP